jgi:ribosomal protein S18 acetylase RimI-like enzyme
MNGLAPRARTGQSAGVVIREMSEGDDDVVASISHLFDDDAQIAATRRFLTSSGHHLLVAYENAGAVGFVTGVEMTHPDKGTEMFLYELGVDENARNKGVGTALVAALADRARRAACYGMWVLTDQDNVAAMRAYKAAGGIDPREHTMISWNFEERP